jgi:SDR family mycofactocin-dependent oxidoreductase
MGKLDGKVAFITGAARGQGRSHAVQLAKAGARIIAVDICRQIPSVPYAMSTPEALAQTVKEVEAAGGLIYAAQADVRDHQALAAALGEGAARFGGVDIVLANAGIAPMTLHPVEEEWQDVLDVNLNGTYNTIRAAVPLMIDQGRGGAIVITSSSAGITGIGGNTPGGLGYTASKHGIVGLMRAYANYLAPHSIRVNTVHPCGVATPMVLNPAMEEVLAGPDFSGEGMTNALPVAMIEPVDVTNAILWLVSDDARYVTGVTLPVDAGFANKK